MDNVKQIENTKKDISLHIDTSDSQKIQVKVVIEGEVHAISSPATFLKSEVLLNLIDKLLHNVNLTTSDIKKVYVHKGPGSFTGVRVGVTVANTLSFALGVPVNDKNLGDIELPEY